jgi:ribose transport system permease protein
MPAAAAGWRPPVALLLFAGSVALYVAVALATRSAEQLGPAGIAGLLGRMVALGTTALGQTFAILCGSIDLSVGTLISVAAVLAASVMHGDPAMIAPAVLAVLALAAAVGCVNGLIIARLRVSPLIATLGTGLVMQGILSAEFTDFTGAVPHGFEVVAYGAIGPLPWSVVGYFLLSLGGAWVLARTRFGAHLYAVGGNAVSARLAGIRTGRVLIQAHVICSVMAGLAGLYLASRLQSGAPWIGRDGVYDLESIAVTVIGGTLLAGGRGGVWGTLAGVLLFAVLDAMFNMLGVPAFPKQVLRGAIVVAAVASYAARGKGAVA